MSTTPTSGEASLNAAEDSLPDRIVFSVSPEAYAEFLALLDAPAQPNERLRKAMQAPAPWDET
jgi:uncharacterized protein (DUF1778 family)